MSDRTSVQLYVYDAPRHEVHAVLAVIDEYELGEYEPPAADRVSLATEYAGHDISCGSAEWIAGKLLNTAPGTSFMVWEDPAYEWLGAVWMHAPDLGTFRAESDANGQAQFNHQDVRALLALDADAQAKAMGDPWRDRFAERAEVVRIAGGIVMIAAPCRYCRQAIQPEGDGWIHTASEAVECPGAIGPGADPDVTL
jgi:hypothetical protein